jgi:hypothetical protein
MSNTQRKDFLVYGYAREKSDQFGDVGTYYYIGKGTKNRPYNCWKSARKTKCPRDRVKNIHILHKDLDEETAFKLEIELIAKYGRIDLYPTGGILLNKTDGGEGGSGNLWGPSHSRYVSRCWCHVDIGFVFNKSSAEICREYYYLNLNRNKLNSVASGLCNSYRGWIVIRTELIEESLSEGELKRRFTPEYARKFLEEVKKSAIRKRSRGNTGEPKTIKNKGYHSKSTRKLISRIVRGKSKRFNWVNYELGIVTSGYTVSDLWEEFNHLNLDRSTLSKVINRKQTNHKGWFCLGEAGTDFSVR